MIWKQTIKILTAEVAKELRRGCKEITPALGTLRLKTILTGIIEEGGLWGHHLRSQFSHIIPYFAKGFDSYSHFRTRGAKNLF